MEDYGPETYGDRIADVYDTLYSGLDTDGAVETLAELAGSGPVLELAIGTGRLALPLAERGLEVHGIDASEAMVAKLREKPGGDAVPVTFGDIADVAVDGSYSLVFVAFNTLFALLTQEDQLRCFANVAPRLADGGAFVIQAFVPDVTLFTRGARLATQFVGVDTAVVDVAELDMASQQVITQHVVLEDGRVSMYPVKLRFAYAPEMDLMARLGGMRLRERWAGWNKEPFGAGSGQHISVYEL